MNKHINKIRNSSCDKDNITKGHHANIEKPPLQINKKPKQNNVINNAHKEHKNKVLIQIKSCNKALKQINNISYDHQKRRKLFNKVLM